MEIKITKDMKTNEAVEKYPAIKEVFVKYFGKGCFDCPAFGSEDIAFACAMHGTNADVFVNECIEAVEKAQKGIEDTLKNYQVCHCEQSEAISLLYQSIC